MNYFKAIKNINIKKEITSRLDGNITGDNYLCLCPFHDNQNTPALGVNILTGVFGCFSCGASGNFFDLIAQLEDITVEQAIEKFCSLEILGIEVKEVPKGVGSLVLNKINETKRSNKVRVLRKDFLTQFKTSEVAYKYLLKRKISVPTARTYDVRWGGGDAYWMDRVIFPVYDMNDRLVSISGRHITDNHQLRKMRHLFGSDQKRGLFGYRQAKYLLKLIRPYRFVVICEGQIDCMSLYEAGVPAVALGKMMLSKNQVSAIISLNVDTAMIGVDANVEKVNMKALDRMYSKLADFVQCYRMAPMRHDWNEQLCEDGIRSISEMFVTRGTYETVKRNIKKVSIHQHT